MSARNEEIQTLNDRVKRLEDLVDKLTQPGSTPPDSRWVLRVGPPFFPAGQGGWVYDPGGQLGAPVVGPTILLS